MDARVYSQCQDLLKKFMEDPLCGLYFKEEYDAGSAEARREYREIIGGRPMDLSKVKASMKDKGRYTFSAWLADMTLIFENAIKFNRGKPVEGIARYYKRKVEKFAERISQTSEEDYAERIAKAYAEYLEILNHPPAGCDISTTCQTIEYLGNNLQEASLSVLVDKLNAIVGQYRKDITAILGNAAKDQSQSLEIDVGKLNDDIVAKLWEFVREKERNSA